MLIFYLLCYATVLKILTCYTQYYAHVETVLLGYIHLYHKIFNMVTVSKVLHTTVVQIVIMLSVLLEYIDH